MKRLLTPIVIVALSAGAGVAKAQLLSNGNLDQTYQQEIVPGFFLPKPAVWVNQGTRTVTGPYEDEMSSEPWAGPAPTPVTTGGASGDDWGVFFKAFSGGGANGPATGHLYQDVSGSAGMTYSLTGWAGAEANYLATRSVFALDFLNASSTVIGSQELDLAAAGLFTANGQPFNYKQYVVTATAPAGTATVRARVSMIDGIANPAGGGQAFVVDDFTLAVVPEPSTAMLGLFGFVALLGIRMRKRSA